MFNLLGYLKRFINYIQIHHDKLNFCSYVENINSEKFFFIDLNFIKNPSTI